MANIFGIEVSGDTYDLEDSQARQDTQQNEDNIGNLSTLETTEKNTVVGAINELFSKSHPSSITVAITVTDNYCALNLPIDAKTAKITGVEVLGAASYTGLNLNVTLSAVKGSGYAALGNIPNYNPQLAGKSGYAIVQLTY